MTRTGKIDGSERGEFAVDYQDILEAARRIRPYVHQTPVVTCQKVDKLARGKELFFKCENMQKVGAFKFRGACNAVLQLSDEEAASGVCTHSSGNHAQAVALAAKIRSIPAHVVMPSNASSVKREAVLEYGANVVECDPSLDAREKTVAQVQTETGARMIPPFDHPHVIAGQGTAALELLDQVPDLDALIAPIGGGGLISGTAIVGQQKGIRVFGAEPAGADDAYLSKTSGVFVPSVDPDTIADGLLTSLGAFTWPIIRDLVEAIIVVPDEKTIDAMKFFWSRTKQIIEPSAAVAVAAALSSKFPEQTSVKRVGIILSGGNLSLDQLPWQS